MDDRSGLAAEVRRVAARLKMIDWRPNVGCAGRSQWIDATHALKRSAGVSYPSVFRGRSLSCLATALSFA